MQEINLISQNRKVYDSVYGFISFPKEIWQFIDTPQFQRLRNIKQLGCLSWVFPGAIHTRFQHSLGTGHLAQLFIKTLINRHDETKRHLNQQVYKAYYGEPLQVFKSNKDTAIFTVTLAGILHDIGHGPFSHLFDSKVINEINKEQWSHQLASLHLIDSLYEQIIKRKKDELEKKWLEGTKNRVKALIIGKIQKLQYKKVGNQLVKGLYYQDTSLKTQFREEFKRQLKTRPWQFQIVSNRLTGIDVDKLDYFRRDAYYMGAKDIYIDHQLLISQSLILPSPNIALDGTWQVESKKHRICFPSKYADKVYDVFYSRYKLYKTYYFSLKANGVDFMIAQILVNVKEQFKLQEACNQLIHNNYKSYIRLTDSILERVQDAYNDLRTKYPELQSNCQHKQSEINKKLSQRQLKVFKAGQILNMLKRRQIYQFIKEYHKSYSNVCAYQKIKRQIKEKIIKAQKYKNQGVIIRMVQIGFGIKDEDIFQQCKFYDKSQGEKKILKSNKNLFSMLKPTGVVEISIRVYLNKRLKETSKLVIDKLEKIQKNIFQDILQIDQQFAQGHSGSYTVRPQSKRNNQFSAIDKKIDGSL